MARGKGKGGKRSGAGKKRAIEPYEHTDKQRVNNPPVGLVTPETDPPAPTHKTYEHHPPVPSVKPGNDLDYDPHLDPQLVWAGKKEHTSFEVPTVSLHVHERIDPRTIIETVRKRNGSGLPVQPSLFERPQEKLPLRDAIDFYKHAHGWSNRLIAGDSLLVMNSLLEKEGMAGQVQMVYIDPPYGIKYGSNFQPFVNKRDVKDGKDEDLTAEPEMIRAFRDTWELGIHSYLTYLRDRLLLARELLNEKGSCFVQIGEDNLHIVRNLLDEAFGSDNFMSLITFRVKNMPFGAKYLENMYDHLLWYAKEKDKVTFRRAFIPRPLDPAEFSFVEEQNGTRRKVTDEERRSPDALPPGSRLFSRLDLYSSGYTPTCIYEYEFDGTVFKPETGKSWKTTKEGMAELERQRRLMKLGTKLYFVFYFDDYPLTLQTNFWDDTAGGFSEAKRFVVETHPKVVQRCMLLTTDPGDLVLDPTCGSGTTAFVAEQWGRRWITCDTSRVAITLAKQRLMTAVYDYYELAHSEEGVSSGFRYRKAPHITLGSIAQREPPGEETLYDQPYVDKSRARVSGPLTVEAVPAPTVRSLDEIEADKPAMAADASVARKGATLRHSEWRDELLKTGMRGKGGQMIHFSRVEPLAGTRWLHADAETKGTKPERVVFSFGPEHGPLEQRQVEMAWEEARTLIPKPSIIVFAAFQFDPEAAKDIDELTKEKTGMTFLTAQMNADLLTEDLRKKRASNQSFWLVGRPDVDLRQVKSGEHKGKWQVEVRGFDYYNTRTGTIESGDTSKIAMWLLDTDYDGRSLLPRQVFFPMADDDEGWAKLARNLKAEIDPEMIEQYRGTVSLPFEAGHNKRVAVKVIDDRGIESLKVVDIR
jgi:adenine-specific DNA-methyltransferase